VSPKLVGAVVGAAVDAAVGAAVGGRVHVVNTSVAEAPLDNVYGPATTTSPLASFKVQDAPVQPSPELSIMYRVFSARGE
jgi:hypothetical protein